VWKFRAKPGDMSDGAPIHGNTLLEVIWVTIPFLLVSGLAVYGWIVLDDIEDRKPDTLIVNVSGQQFAWTFHYPQQRGVPKGFSTNDPQLPKGRPVEFDIRSADVIHSFWIPDFRLKSDAVPGLKTQVRVEPRDLGSHDIVCAELCGLGHSTMRQSATVVEPSDFENWAGKQNGGSGPGGGQAKAPADVHSLADVASLSKVGAVQ
jgi:cytochrome c oxidase subunit 2